MQTMPQNTNWGIPSPQQQSGNGSSYPSSSFWGQAQPPQSMPQWSQPQPPQQWSQFQHTPQSHQANSLLPIPYQGGMGLQQVPQSNAMQVMPAPAQDITIAPPYHEEGVVYVPPMYTKPRPIIPRYRIISGFISVIIVTLMLCGGASYYAKASGKLDMVSRVLTGNNPPPQSIQPTTPSLPDPSDQIIRGTAYNIISSATTTSHFINGTTIAAQTDRIFKPNEAFYLTYSVYPPTTGKVTIKWYMNNLSLPYQTIAGDSLPAQGGFTGMARMVYATPAEGKVELYWNDELAQTLFFVVRD
ncbi:MAG: hypothetical protein NVS4B11_15570 [Ktedonobacteraceae bacterium]